MKKNNFVKYLYYTIAAFIGFCFVKFIINIFKKENKNTCDDEIYDGDFYFENLYNKINAIEVDISDSKIMKCSPIDTDKANKYAELDSTYLFGRFTRVGSEEIITRNDKIIYVRHMKYYECDEVSNVTFITTSEDFAINSARKFYNVVGKFIALDEFEQMLFNSDVPEYIFVPIIIGKSDTMQFNHYYYDTEKLDINSLEDLQNIKDYYIDNKNSRCGIRTMRIKCDIVKILDHKIENDYYIVTLMIKHAIDRTIQKMTFKFDTSQNDIDELIEILNSNPSMVFVCVIDFAHPRIATVKKWSLSDEYKS